MVYLADTNVFIQAKNYYYGFDIVPQFWDWLLEVAEQGKLKIPPEIIAELLAGSTQDELTRWITANRDVLEFTQPLSRQHLNRVWKTGYAANLSAGEENKIGNDAFLIAHAYFDKQKLRIVTMESSRPRATRANRKIPDVCATLGITCINTFKLIRELKFRAR